MSDSSRTQPGSMIEPPDGRSCLGGFPLTRSEVNGGGSLVSLELSRYDRTAASK